MNAASPFIVFALPRSRTFWLSKFLARDGWQCGHDEIRHMRGFDDVTSFFSQPMTGTVETAGAPWWRLLPEFAPDIRIATIRRDPAEVIDSLRRQGFSGMERLIRSYDKALDQIETRMAGVVRVDYPELNERAEELFEFCTGMPCPEGWLDAVAPLNLQCDIFGMVRYARAFGPQMTKFAKMAMHRTIAGMRPKVESDIEGLTIEQEPFDVFMRDSQEMFAEHLVAVGEAPDNWLNKNLAAMHDIDRAGNMHMTVARSNGRVFGYLMAITGPSLESPNVVTAMHLLFYASPLFPGLGMKLQRSSVASLKARGVGEIFFRDGIRGMGGRLGTIYRRLGAAEFGQMYKLEVA